MRIAIPSIIFFLFLCSLSSFLLPAKASSLSVFNVMDTIRPNDTITWGPDILPIEVKTDNDTLPIPQAARPTDIPGVIKTEEKDLPPSAIPWFSEEQLQNPFTLSPNYVDTNLLNFHHYDFAAQKGLFYAHKGNPGHAYRPLIFNPVLTPGLDPGHLRLYGDYIFTHEQLRYYRPKHVFTDLYYMIGDNREQLFHGKHSQKLHETLFLGFQYRVVNSPGAYSRLGSRNVNLYLTADYLHPSKRYQALGSFVLNRMRNQQSGGLRNPAAFEDDAVSDSVFLFRAESWYRDVSVNLRHFYQTGFYSGGDTVQQGRFINLGRFNHGFTYARKAFNFVEDAQPYPFYDYTPHYPQTTFDSTVIHQIKNEVSWSNFPLESGRGTFPFNFRIFLQHSINTIQQPMFPEDQPLVDSLNQNIFYYDKYNYNEIIQGIELQSDQTRFLSFGGFANVTVGGYNDEDFHAGAYLNLGRPDKNYHIDGLLRVANMEAPYFYNTFRSNYISWDNDFSKMQVLNLRGRLHSPWVRLEGNYYLLNNMVYFNREALPVQNTSGFGFISLGAYSDIEVGRFGFRNHGVYQYSTTANFEDYPAFISYHSVYFKLDLFNRSLISQFGFDLHFNPGYQAMSWMPVTRAFYAQDNYTTRNKFLADVFWSGKIKRARLFVKYQNLLGLIIDTKPHYDIPFYPVPETMFKFGVSWMFFD